eukprot:scaffold164_cov212-Alexandrium_tamarense.AAC.26
MNVMCGSRQDRESSPGSYVVGPTQLLRQCDLWIHYLGEVERQCIEKSAMRCFLDTVPSTRRHLHSTTGRRSQAYFGGSNIGWLMFKVVVRSRNNVCRN